MSTIELPVAEQAAVPADSHVAVRTPVPAPRRTNPLGTIAFVFALIGTAIAAIPFVAMGAWLITLPAAVLAIIAVTRRRPRRLATAALVIATTGWVLSIVVTIVSLSAAGVLHITTKNAPEVPVRPATTSRAHSVPDTSPTFQVLTPTDFGAIVTDPGAANGQLIVAYATVTEHDANTGTCTALAHTTADAAGIGQREAVNTVLTSGDGESHCPMLSHVGEGDTLRLQVRVLGSYTYANAAGGKTTAPAFEVLSAERL